jgi:membrane associated rhomboid family serine protease
MDDATEISAPVCYRHPDRVTGLSCTRCGRSICVECSHDAAVGQLCPECAKPDDRHRVVTRKQIIGRPSFGTAPVSMGIIAFTAAIFLIGALSPEAERWLFVNLAQFNILVNAGEWWRVFSAALLHASIMHILFNMYALYLFGPRLEQQVGSPAFAALYLASAGAGGAAAYVLLGTTSTTPLVGASGAIFGLFGAWIFVAWRMRNTPGGRSMFTNLMVLLGINLALPLFIPNIAWEAHLGGLVAGFAIAYLWSIFAVGKPNAIGIRTAIATGVIALDLAVVLIL